MWEHFICSRMKKPLPFVLEARAVLTGGSVVPRIFPKGFIKN